MVKELFHGVLVACLFMVGCQTPLATPLPTTAGVAKLPTLAVGKQCTVTLATDTPGKTLSYEGRIKAADGEEIVLAKPLRIARQEQSSGLPVVGPLFKNVGMARDELKEDITIERADIIDARLISPPPSDVVDPDASPEPQFDE